MGLLASGCEARSSVEAAQTAVVAVQTALPSAQTALSTLDGLLAGASLAVETMPPDADNNAVTDVTIQGSDTSGALGRLAPAARQATASAALAAAAQYYPNATISLTVTDGSGATLVSGRKAAGQAPSVQ